MGRRPRSPRETLRGPPQGFQEASTGTQEPPRQPQEAPKKLPGNPHERPNSPAEAPDSPPNKPQRAPMGTLTHKPSHGGGIAPRRPRWPLKSLRLRRLQNAPRSLQEASQEGPERLKSLISHCVLQWFFPSRLFGFPTLQDDPRGPQDRPKTAQEASKRAPKRPKRPSGRPQDDPRDGLQDG